MADNPRKQRLVLLDMHAILHRAYHALPDFSSNSGEPTGALFGLITMILKIIGELKPDYIVATYDVPKPTFRKVAYADYKGKRGKTDDALIAQIIRSKDILAAFSIPVYEKEGFEADDIIGSIVEEAKDMEVDIVIASGDMDTLQLVEGKRVQVYTLKKGIQDTILYDDEAVKNRFGFGPKLLPDYKALRGDPSDNIPGVRGVGEKTATQLITSYGTIEALYKALHKDASSVMDKASITERIAHILIENEEEAVFSKMLALIRRDADVSFSLPTDVWDKALNLKEIDTLFKELDFRTLTDRLLKTIQKTNGDEEVVKNETLFVQDTVDEALLRKASVALWVLDSNITNPKYDDVLRYTETDTLEKAFDTIKRKLEKENLLHVYSTIEEPLIAIIENMEERGIRLDVPSIQNLSKEFHVKKSLLEKEIKEIAGVDFNLNSPKQLGDVLFTNLEISPAGISKTSTGARSTRESELEKIRDKHPIVEKIFEYRELQKLLSTYIDVLPTLVDAKSRLHTTFLQHGTTTGRISSQNPNLQNIPIKTEQGRYIRKSFIAQEGYTLVSFDYSQIELRVAAFLSQDEKLINIFKSGGDVHTAVAAQVFEVPEQGVDREMRRKAKVINFGILYGMGINALRKNLGTPRAEAQEFLNSYFETFSQLKNYLDISKISARQKGYAETFFGRRRVFNDIRSKIPHIQAAAERMAINAPIQGTAADIIKIAMVRVDEYLKKHSLDTECFSLLQIHDELLFEIKNELVETVIQPIRRSMEEVISLEDTGGVPLIVEASYGDNWLDMEKI